MERRFQRHLGHGVQLVPRHRPQRHRRLGRPWQRHHGAAHHHPPAAPGTPFTVYGAQPQRDAVGFGLALETKVADNAAAFLRYDGEVGAGFDHHGLNIGLHFRW